MALDQLAQFRILHWPIREISTQSQNGDEGSMRFSDRSQQQLDETASLVFSFRLGKELLELID